ncbi:hypothetical protein L6452_01847 [Arctium lappa]|uniref:Uncharacterized protein n=1 Tax=Arctium lappa TaxID=4217 RepID=A0ACB9FI75_ARCLA|nr:hypothetical protein L6452_01847 [Arctium lappa]
MQVELSNLKKNIEANTQKSNNNASVFYDQLKEMKTKPTTTSSHLAKFSVQLKDQARAMPEITPSAPTTISISVEDFKSFTEELKHNLVTARPSTTKTPQPLSSDTNC